MATVIGSLLIEMSANVARLQKDMAEATSHVGKASEEMVRASEMAKGALAALGIGLGMHEFKDFVMNSIEASARLNELSQRSGVSVQNLNGLKYAATQTGADFEEMTKGVKKMSLYLADADINGGKHADMLKTLGITAKDPMEAMYQLSDAMQRIPDAAQRTYVAQQLLGKGGEAMMPSLLEGGDALRKLIDEGNKLNPVTTESARLANEFSDKLDRLRFAAQGNATVLTTAMLPALNDTVDSLAFFSREGTTAKDVGEVLGNVIKGFVFVAGTAALAVRTFTEEIGYLYETSAALLSADQAALDAADKKHAEAQAASADQYGKFVDTLLEGSQKQEDAQTKVEKSTINLADAAAALNKQYLTLEQQVARQTHLFELAAESENKLTATEKLRSDIQDKIISGTLSLSSAQQAHIDTMLREMAVAEALAQHRNEERAAQTEALKVIEKANSTAAEDIRQADFEISLLGKSTEERKRLTEARNVDLRIQREIQALNANAALAKEPAWLAAATAAVKAEGEAAQVAKDKTLDLQKALAGQTLNKVGTETDQYKSKLDAARAYHEQAKTQDADYASQVQQIEMAHQAALMQIGVSGQMSRNEFEAQTMQTQVGIVSGILKNSTGQAAQHNRAMFEINKQANAANAVISTIAGATKALELGPIIGPIMAGIIYTAGMMNVAAIESASFGGGGANAGSAPTGGGATSGIPGQTANPNVIGASPAPTQQPATQPVNVYVQGNVMTPDFVTNTIIPEIKNQISNADVTIIDPRSRQAQMLAVPA